MPKDMRQKQIVCKGGVQGGLICLSRLIQNPTNNISSQPRSLHHKKTANSERQRTSNDKQHPTPTAKESKQNNKKHFFPQNKKQITPSNKKESEGDLVSTYLLRGFQKKQTNLQEMKEDHLTTGACRSRGQRITTPLVSYSRKQNNSTNPAFYVIIIVGSTVGSTKYIIIYNMESSNMF